VVDESQLPMLPGAIELYRAALAQVRGDVPALIRHATRVLELATADGHVGRAAGSSMLGIAYWSQGELEAARLAWTEGKNGLQRAGHIADVLGVSIALADINLVQGHLREAIRICEEALALAAVAGGPVLKGTADMHAGLSALYRERNELEAARRHLAKSQELGERAGLPQHPYRWRVAAAHLKQDEGDLAGAVALLDEAERVYVSDFFPLVRPVAAMRARVWIAEGRLDEARRWQDDSDVGIADDLSYVHEFEHITLARLLLAEEAQGKAGGLVAIVAFLDRLLEAADRGGRNRSVIEILVLIAIAQRHADADAALAALERALALAAPEGFARVFIEAGQPMAALLKLAVKRRIAADYAGRLLTGFGQPEERPPVHPDLIEKLSERELDVLRLLRSDLDGPEIARELGMALNTMRTHTKNIFEKLGVNNRRSAVRRAEELKLLAGGPRP
jgi:LuxR family maltose regulon positive regulatory protein